MEKFRQFPCDLFVHVVFDSIEYSYWTGNTDVATHPDFPALVHIKSTWEDRAILFRLPSGKHPPTLDERKPYPEEVIEKTRRECKRELVRMNTKEADYMAGWNTFLDSLHTRPQPSELWPFDAPPSSDEHPRVSVRAAEEASPSVPFTPALEGPVMRSGPAAPPPRRRQVPGVELTELAANSFAFVRIAAEAGSSRGKSSERPFPLPCCLVQLPPAFPADFDHFDPKATLKVKWWRPSESALYEDKWFVWFNGNRHWEGDIQRGMIVLVGVGMYADSNKQKILREKWAQVTVESLRLLPLLLTICIDFAV